MNPFNWFVASILPGSRAAMRRRDNAYELELMVQLSGFVAARETTGETIEIAHDMRGAKAVSSKMRLK